MKRIATLLLSLTTLVGYTQNPTEIAVTEVNTTLVNNQLSPEIVKIENAAGFSQGTFKSQDGKEVNRFRQSIFTFAAYPLALISKPQTQLYVGIGYTNQQFSQFSNESYSSLFKENIKSLYVSTAFSTRIKKKTFWFSYVQNGLNGTKPLEEMDKTYNLVMINKISYKARRNLNVGVGFAYFTNMGSPLVLPAITFTYSQPKFVVNLDFPLKTEVEGVFAQGKFRPVVGLSYHGGNYYLKNEQQYLYNFGALGYMGMRYKLLDLVYLYAAYQVGVYDQYRSGSASNLTEIGTYSGQGQVVFSLNVQVAKFVPLLQQ